MLVNQRLGQSLHIQLGLSLSDSLLSGSPPPRRLLSGSYGHSSLRPFVTQARKIAGLIRASAVLGQATTEECFEVKATKTDNSDSLLSDAPLLYKTCLPFFTLKNFQVATF